MNAVHSGKALEETIRYLHSQNAHARILLDPYWPKWDSPWWRMTLLWEMGMADLIPRDLARSLGDAVNTHYLHFFPIRENDLPAGKDPYRHIICHCAAGTILQVINAVDPSYITPMQWLRDYLLLYQLPDGGLNCDESVYTNDAPKSSIVSTLPPLEAILRTSDGTFSEKELNFLDAGARYLIRHRLVRKSSGEFMDASWLRLCFPRFYHYDILRGLSFLIEYSEKLNRSLPGEVIAEAVALLESNNGVCIGRKAVRTGEMTVRWTGSAWTADRDAATFDLLEEVSIPGCGSSHLQRSYDGTMQGIRRLMERHSV
jgi:hypothetical protein